MEPQNTMLWMWKNSMKLHHNKEDFEELIELTAQWMHIPSAAVRKDYFITLLKNYQEIGE